MGGRERSGRMEMSGIERLRLRASEMINHPVAQTQRWVTIHRLDTDGDREWQEVMGDFAETDDLEISVNDDESVTLRWLAPLLEDRPPQDESFEVEAPAPF